jgi:FAD/FMN-containing dehydrogenase
VTGVCECVGLAAPLLGGGHGILQGQYGLAADQLVSARLILANGTIITVSNASHPDLFWGLRGAGHNFGVVSEYTMKTYDVDGKDNWALNQFVFTENQVEELYTVTERLRATQPANVVIWGLFISMPMIDPVKVRSRYGRGQAYVVLIV